MAVTLAMQVQCLLDGSVPNLKIAKVLKTNLVNVEAIAAGEWNAVENKPHDGFRLQRSKERIKRVKRLLARKKSPRAIADMAKISIAVVEALLAEQWDEERCEPNRVWLAAYKNRRRIERVQELREELAELESEIHFAGCVPGRTVAAHLGGATC